MGWSLLELSIKKLFALIILVILLLFVVKFESIVYAVDGFSDFAGNNIADISNMIKTQVYKMVLSFTAKSNYNLDIYPQMFSDTDEILKCRNFSKLKFTNIGQCLKSNIDTLNARADIPLKYSVGLMPKLKEDKDYVRFYDFIETLYGTYNYQIEVDSLSELCTQECAYKYSFSGGSWLSDYKIKMKRGLKGTIFSRGDLSVETDFLVGYQSNGFGYYDFSEREFDLEDEPYLIKSDSGILLYFEDDNKQMNDDYINNMKVCGQTKNIYNFYAEYDSFFGKQFIPFSLDFTMPYPKKVSDFKVEQKKNAENTFVLSWDTPVIDQAKTKDSLVEQYRVYCAPSDFSSSVNCVVFESIDANKDKYEIEVSSCNGTSIETGKEYYFVITSVDSSGKFERKELVKKSAVAIDELAPGLAKTYKQEFVVSKSDVKGKIIHEKPTINEDGSELSNFSSYMLLFTDKKYENALLTKLADMTLDKCNSGQIDFTTPIFCYPIEPEKKETPMTDFTNDFVSFDSTFNLVVYLIPIDKSGNFIKEPNVWSAKYLDR